MAYTSITVLILACLAACAKRPSGPRENQPKAFSADSDASQTQAEKDCHFDWSKIDDPEFFACFNSIGDVMKDLPDPVRPYWVMVHQTESNQKASMEEPRVIINDPTGRFILATETVPGGSKHVRNRSQSRGCTTNYA